MDCDVFDGDGTGNDGYRAAAMHASRGSFSSRPRGNRHCTPPGRGTEPDRQCEQRCGAEGGGAAVVDALIELLAGDISAVVAGLASSKNETAERSAGGGLTVRRGAHDGGDEHDAQPHEAREHAGGKRPGRQLRQRHAASMAPPVRAPVDLV